MRSLSRIAGAVTAAAGVAIALLVPATAQAFSYTVVELPNEKGHEIDIKDANGKHWDESPRMWGLSLSDGRLINVYCIEHEKQAGPGSTREEKPWTSYPTQGNKADPAKVIWILHNSYPTLGLDALETAATAAGFPVDLDKKEAISATAAAIWHYSQSTTLETHSNGDINKLYAYLTQKAVAIKPVTPELTITPANDAVKAGEDAGPYDVQTNADSVKITFESIPAEGKLVDKDGNPVGATVEDDAKLYIKTPKDKGGKATIKGDAEWTLLGGRLFTHPQKQDFVYPMTEKKALSATAKAEWTYTAPPTTPAPTPTPTPTTPPLPTTGNAPSMAVMAGGMLLALGAIAAVVARRRRSNSVA